MCISVNYGLTRDYRKLRALEETSTKKDNGKKGSIKSKSATRAKKGDEREQLEPM
jgi:hypothetical protein